MTGKQRRGLSSSGLDAVIPAAATAPTQSAPAPTAAVTAAKPAARSATKPASQPATPSSAGKVKFGGYIDPEIAERARDALSWLGGAWTTGALLEEGIELALARLQKEHNGGKPFPARKDERLRRGPRIS
ncbi:hypothetical protein [Nakamurella multipartita]|uniref:Centromere-binding protein ParB C-terminal domain-containing protein n=1 Tax=Nakamurella multipartita (strain ATCC 700099 / DSM 44233 / CIP 104796 / JCM 9543 / NBRC 105858 / Y-104) TaxID=479431 RepID=C8XEY9_NAKMY|nr:hypothetical protein [Nakamurella multipartita]ACV79890.1 hypothetical protein Namu_3568 [Nakamurella multipartita DSM 44233]